MNATWHRKFLVTIIFSIVSMAVWAGPGDTTTVQTFTFGSPLEGKFLFPDSTHRWGKILMEYTLKCNPAQSPACGEWDYLTYTYLYKHTGRLDSTRYTHSNFTFQGATPDSLMYMDGLSWQFQPWFEYYNQTPVASLTKVGDTVTTTSAFFSSLSPDSRSQTLYTKEELVAGNLAPGEVTGIRYKVSQAGAKLKRLRIRLKNSPSSALGTEPLDDTGFTTVFDRNWQFTQAGWQTLPFTLPFLWDGNSNILIDISYEAQLPGIANEIFCGNEGPTSLIGPPGRDAYLNFRDMDFVDLPFQPFEALDSGVTIAFWQYGDPLLQPQNNTIFEGIDSAGHRVLNLHLPWGDGKVYWDAGNDGSTYDRLVFPVSDPTKYRGRWNHWALTKDVKFGRMKIFLNGELVYLGGSRYRTMQGIRKFRIGSDGNGTGNFYDGRIDDFSIWNMALSDTAIKLIMYRDIDATHPNYEQLIGYYRFNTGSGFIATDDAPGANHATLVGYPEWHSYLGKELFRNFEPVTVRPGIIFEQGIYNPATLDSLFRVDTVAGSPIMIVLFSDTLHPYLPTDTLTKYPAWYEGYVYNPQGEPIDSTLVPPDGVLHRKDYVYYGKPFELTERYELARYITPYGNGLSLGDGWTWYFDLTDYAPLLRDSVHLSAGNWQELLDMKFKMIEGIPPRDVFGVKNIYTGTHGYANESQHNLPPVTVMVKPEVRNARLKMRITGHGFGGTLNCSEFCDRTNTLMINDALAYTHYVWRSDCGLNPLYPQGGTWLYDRAEWCPGAEVRTKDFELTPYLTPGDSMTIDYNLQPGYTWNNEGSWPYYAIESQLITYGTPNFRLDAAVEEIISPNSNKLYNRFNPLCGQPKIAVKNNGSDTLKNFVIEYGPSGGKTQRVAWNGELAFQDTVQIYLPAIDWSEWTGGDNRFHFLVKEPNGGVDEYAPNDAMSAAFTIPPTYENQLVFKFKTNHMASSLSWMLADQDGHPLIENGPLENNTIYIDTFNLVKGCYRLIIRNAEGEGIQYWANMPPYGFGTAGYARLYDMEDKIVKSFQGDFGREISQGFTVGMTIEVPELYPAGYLSVHPNPSHGKFTLTLIVEKPQEVNVTVHDHLGRVILTQHFSAVNAESFPIDLGTAPSGVYFITTTTASGTVVKKLVKY